MTKEHGFDECPGRLGVRCSQHPSKYEMKFERLPGLHWPTFIGVALFVLVVLIGGLAK